MDDELLIVQAPETVKVDAGTEVKLHVPIHEPSLEEEPLSPDVPEEPSLVELVSPPLPPPQLITEMVDKQIIEERRKDFIKLVMTYL